MKLWTTQYVNTLIDHRFPVERVFPDTKLSIKEGDIVEVGSVLASGSVPKVVFRKNLKKEYETSDFSGILKVIKGEIVHEGQLLCEGLRKFKSKRIIAPASGIVERWGDELILLKGKEFKEEIIPINGVFSSTDVNYYEIVAEATKIKYSFFLGKLPKYSMPFIYIGKSLEQREAKALYGRAVITSVSLLLSLYENFVSGGAKLVIVPGIRFSDYQELKTKYSELPVPIVIMNSWGIHKLNNQAELIFDTQNKSAVLHIDSDGIYVNYTVSYNMIGGAYDVVEARVGMSVRVNVYPFIGSIGIIKDIINGEHILVELSTGSEIMLDYRNASFTDIILG